MVIFIFGFWGVCLNGEEIFEPLYLETAEKSSAELMRIIQSILSYYYQDLKQYPSW